MLKTTRLFFLALVLEATVCSAQGSLPPNGSFEEGGEAPAGWRPHAGGVWASGEARTGKRSLSGTSEAGGVVWESVDVAVEPGTLYRLEGWVRSLDGSASLGMDLLDEQGQVVASEKSPEATQAASWRYAALEPKTLEARAARIWFHVKGQASLDDVSLAPAAVSIFGNKSVEGDARGRIPFWSEETSDVLPGRRAGKHSLDAETKRSEKTGLLIEPSGDWYAVSSVNYPVPAASSGLELSGWARCEEKGTAEILAAWMDSRQKVLRVDRSGQASGAEWKRIAFTPGAPPPEAWTVRLGAAASGGRVWFDDFDMVWTPGEQRLRIFANQVGYEEAGPKSAVAATSFFPRRSTTIALRIVADDGKVAWEDAVPCSGRIHGGKPDDWGWYFWRVDFSSLRAAGKHRAAVDVEGARAESPPFAVGRGVLLGETARSAVDFFFIQRCGFEVPEWHKACHLDDAKLADGTRIDATGGWHSAGDYNKPMWQFGDGGVAYALAAAGAARPDIFAKLDRDRDGMPDILDEAWWGAKFLAKMQNPADGSMRGDVLQGPGRDWMKWTAPDVHTDNVPGTADDPVIAPGNSNTPLTVASWALVGKLLDERGIKNDYLERAGRLWDFLAAQEGAASNPLLLLDAIELHRALELQGTAGGARFEEFARRSAEALLKSQKPNGSFPGDTGDHGDVAAAALALFALEPAEAPLRPQVEAALAKYLDFCLARADNPFGLARQGVEGSDPPIFHPTVGLGVNFWLLGRAWSTLLIHRLTGDVRALLYAADQLDWVLGKNPLGLCMFEGKGVLNPPRYHHRYNMIPGRERGAVPGAIPNGFVWDMGLADRPGFDLSAGGNRAPSFRTSEPWLVHNLFYLLAAAEYDRATAGK